MTRIFSDGLRDNESFSLYTAEGRGLYKGITEPDLRKLALLDSTKPRLLSSQDFGCANHFKKRLILFNNIQLDL